MGTHLFLKKHFTEVKSPRKILFRKLKAKLLNNTILSMMRNFLMLKQRFVTNYTCIHTLSHSMRPPQIKKFIIIAHRGSIGSEYSGWN